MCVSSIHNISKFINILEYTKKSNLKLHQNKINTKHFEKESTKSKSFTAFKSINSDKTTIIKQIKLNYSTKFTFSNITYITEYSCKSGIR